MSEKTIPEHIDPFRYAEQSLGLNGILKVSEMQRIAPNLLDKNAIVNIELQFGVDEQKTTYVNGHIETSLSLQCQRCMEPMVYEIMSDFSLGVVTTLEEENSLSEQYEPAMAVDGNLALRELIEDEIILNLPIIPRHEPDQCKVQLPLVDAGWEQGEGKNPFHVLESIKQKRN